MGCGEPHYYKSYPHFTRIEPTTNVLEASIVGEVERSMPRINVALEYHCENYQHTMIEFEGKLFNQFMSILVDQSTCLSYVSPKVVENCQLKISKYKNPWLVQLNTREKTRVNDNVPKYYVEIGDQHIKADLSILSLVSYDVLIRTDWLEGNWSLVDCK